MPAFRFILLVFCLAIQPFSCVLFALFAAFFSAQILNAQKMRSTSSSCQVHAKSGCKCVWTLYYAYMQAAYHTCGIVSREHLKCVQRAVRTRHLKWSKQLAYTWFAFGQLHLVWIMNYTFALATTYDKMHWFCVDIFSLKEKSMLKLF